MSLSFIPSLGIFKAGPLLPLFFIIALSYFRKGFEPLFLAALSGFIFDFFSSYPFGFYLILFLGASLVVRIMFQEGMKELSFYFYLILSVIFLFIYSITEVIIMYLSNVPISVNIFMPILQTIIINITFSFFLYFGIVWYFDKIKDIENVLKRRWKKEKTYLNPSLA